MNVPQVDVQTLASEQAAGRRIFDVREVDEYEEVRLAGVTLIPMAEVAEEIEQFEGADPVYVVCHTGSRSGRVVEYLRRNGIDAVNVAGGMVAWIQAGLPTESGPR
jgi:rhodanese-related sulfurtransferase